MFFPFMEMEEPDKNTQIAIKKTLPKLLGILMILNERAIQYQDAGRSQEEVEKHVPEDIMDLVVDLKGRITDGISFESEGCMEELDNRFNGYFKHIGPDSLDVAEAVADPSLERAETLTRDAFEVLSRYVGANPFPVLKNQMPFIIISPGGNLARDESLDKRVENVNQVLAQEGKSLDDVSGMSLDDILRIRKRVKKREQTVEPREFYGQQIAEKYAQRMLDLSREMTPEKTAATPEIEELYGFIREQLLAEGANPWVPDKAGALRFLESGGLDYILTVQARMVALRTAKQFLSCAIDMEYIHNVRELASMEGLDVEIDGKPCYVSPLDYIELSRKDLSVLKKIKDHLVDIAISQDLNSAVTDEAFNEGTRFAYGDRDSYVSHQRLKQRVEAVFNQSLTYGGRIPIEELTSNPFYTKTTALIDRRTEGEAQKIFGEN
jgi:hypothetical protein